jgi:hypothetical protein
MGMEYTKSDKFNKWGKERRAIDLMFELNTQTAQSLGALFTHIRRYSVSAFLGLATEEDTDARHMKELPDIAPPKLKKPEPKKPTSTPKKPIPKKPEPDVKKINTELKELKTKLGEEIFNSTLKEIGVNLKGASIKQAEAAIAALKIKAEFDEFDV